MHATRRIVIAAVFVAIATPAFATERIERAKQFFSDYVAKSHSFDPGVADLYSDDAIVVNRRTFPDGNVRELSLPGVQYKALIRNAMPAAKSRGDRSDYLNPIFTDEGTSVRIKVTRHSILKNYSSPLSLLVGPDANGMWLVREELSESRP